MQSLLHQLCGRQELTHADMSFKQTNWHVNVAAGGRPIAWMAASHSRTWGKAYILSAECFSWQMPTEALRYQPCFTWQMTHTEGELGELT